MKSSSATGAIIPVTRVVTDAMESLVEHLARLQHGGQELGAQEFQVAGLSENISIHQKYL